MVKAIPLAWRGSIKKVKLVNLIKWKAPKDTNKTP